MKTLSSSNENKIKSCQCELTQPYILTFCPAVEIKLIRVSTCLCHLHLICICKLASPIGWSWLQTETLFVRYGFRSTNGKARSHRARPLRHVALGEATRGAQLQFYFTETTYRTSAARYLSVLDLPLNKGECDSLHPGKVGNETTSSKNVCFAVVLCGSIWQLLRNLGYMSVHHERHFIRVLGCA